jgi:topoisomerase-4 subunit A
MFAQEILQIGRAKRGLMVLRELKNNPHRIVYMNSSNATPLLITTAKGTVIEVDENNYPIGERTSNGSFAIDEKVENGVYEVRKQGFVNIEEDTTE